MRDGGVDNNILQRHVEMEYFQQLPLHRMVIVAEPSLVHLGALYDRACTHIYAIYGIIVSQGVLLPLKTSRETIASQETDGPQNCRPPSPASRADRQSFRI